jgi:hypothetical protein
LANLKFNEKQIFEKLFDNGGYVLDFSNRTFGEFFSDFNIDIFSEKYNIKSSGSKMNRLRAFWELENNELVGQVLEGLLEYANTIDKIEVKDYKQAQQYIMKLQGKKTTEPIKKELSENDLLKQEFKAIDISKLNLDYSFESVIKQRLEEIELSLNSGASLAVIFLCGSTLEGLLLNIATQNPQKFNISESAPKKDNKVKQLHEWTLDNLINVAYDVGIIKLDIKKFSHSLKDFRNYIHPRQQASQNFNPDRHTAEISWKVLQATIANLSKER